MIREGARGITRPARPKGGRTGIRANARPKGRLGLDGQGLQAPTKGKKCQPFTSRLALDRARDECLQAETTGSVHDSPARRVAPHPFPQRKDHSFKLLVAFALRIGQH